jgi:hypothetical protein
VVAGGGVVTYLKEFNMKKVIFCLLIICLFATPCFAQITTEKYFVPEGTLWKLVGVSELEGLTIGFYNTIVWECFSGQCVDFSNSHYSNKLIAEFYGDISTEIYVYGTLIPILGIGNCYFCGTDGCTKVRLIKISSRFSTAY